MAAKRKAAVKKAPARKTGRPTKYNPQAAQKVLDRLESGESLVSICRDPSMPSRKTAYRWIDAHEEFRHRYAQARELGADYEFDELEEIAATATPETVQVVKLMIDTRKWKLARKFPKKYGDKVTNELVGPGGGPVETNSTIVFKGVGPDGD